MYCDQPLPVLPREGQEAYAIQIGTGGTVGTSREHVLVVRNVSASPWHPTSVTTSLFPFQVHHLLSNPSAHKLLILSGQSLEPGGDLILQSGTYSYQDFAQVLHNPEVSSVSG